MKFFEETLVNLRLSVLLASVVLLLTACASAPQLPVPLTAQTFAVPGVRVGIAVTALPVVNTFFPGAGCLLCLAAAELNHTTMSAHVKSLPYENLPAVKDEIAAILKKKGHTVVMLDKLDMRALPDFKHEGKSFARTDFTSLKGKYSIDKLVVVTIAMAGIERNYASYIPVAPPKARIVGTGYLVNLDTNALEWYMPLDVMKASDGEWDEPPKFPGLTNAYFQTLETSRSMIVAPFQQ